MLIATMSTSPAAPPAATPAQPQRRLRLRWWFLAGLAVLLAAAALAPTFVAQTELRQRVLPALFPEYPGRIHVAAAILSWNAPVVLQDVTWFDLEHRPLAEIPVIRSRKSLWEIATGFPHVGGYQLDRPQLHIRIVEGGSNVEEVLAALRRRADARPGRTSWELEIHEGAVIVGDVRQPVRSELRGVSGVIRKAPGQSPELTAELAAQFDPGGPASPLTASYARDPAAAADAFPPSLGTVKAAGIPLAAVGPLIQRLGSTLEASGQAAFDVDWQQRPGDHGPNLQARATWESDRVELSWRRSGNEPPTAVRIDAGRLKAAVSAPLAVTGAEVLHRAAGQADLEWRAAELFGFAVDAGRLSAELDHSVVRISELDVAVTGGRIRAQPQILLAESPWLLTLDSGRVVEDVHFTPEMCRTWLRFVAPVTANATSIEGRFSVDVASARVPLTAPENADLAAALAIERATLGPGPMVRLILGTIEQVQALFGRRAQASPAAGGPLILAEIPRQDVSFRLAQGRVSHELLKVRAAGADVWTSGSVGWDHSLELVIHVPLQDAWVQRVPGWKGQVIRLPVGGTLEKPEIDRKVWGELARQLSGAAAGGLLQNLLEQQLDKLFQPK